MNKNGSWRSKLFLLLLIIALIIIAVSLANNWRSAQNVNNEIVQLQNEIQNLEQENYQFKELIDYFNSTAYIEEKARLDLGLKKEGEKVVVVTDNVPEQSQKSSENSNNTIAGQPEGNPGKWWEYFFK